jgi:hypothetical protein
LYQEQFFSTGPEAPEMPVHPLEFLPIFFEIPDYPEDWI